jgi:hypothetical protein
MRDHTDQLGPEIVAAAVDVLGCVADVLSLQPNRIGCEAATGE